MSYKSKITDVARKVYDVLGRVGATMELPNTCSGSLFPAEIRIHCAHPDHGPTSIEEFKIPYRLATIESLKGMNLEPMTEEELLAATLEDLDPNKTLKYPEAYIERIVARAESRSVAMKGAQTEMYRTQPIDVSAFQDNA